MKAIMRFLKDEEGVTAIEYGLIAAGIAVVIVGALAVLSPQFGAFFGAVAGELEEGTNTINGTTTTQ